MNLTRLVQAGFPVPPGFILTTDAYESFVRDHGLSKLILGVVQDIPSDDPEALQAASQTIRAWFRDHALSASLIAALHDAYADLGYPPVAGEPQDGSLKPPAAVAVRSSATAEDLPGFSFAGQQDTILNVVGEAALQKAVVDCWSSLWTARAIGYRTRNDIDHAAVSLAVVVQEMVSSETSGVLFTANPLTGKRSEVVIDATLGLGEALVSGQVEPDHYVVDTNGHILAKTLGAKALVIHGREGGGTVSVHNDAAAQQALSDVAIRELAQLGRRVEAVFGMPQDIEWAGVDGRLYLLQSRPITTLFPLPEGMPANGCSLSAPPRVMFSFGSVQGMLDPMTPFGRDAIGATLIGAGKLFGAHVTLETQSLLWEAGERLWINVTGLLGNRAGRRLALAALPYVDPSAAQALETLIAQERFPPPGSLRIRTILRVLRVLLPMIGRALRTLLRPDAERRRLLQQLETMLTDFESRFSQLASLPERLAAIRQMADRAFDFVIPQFVPRFGIGMATYNLLTHLAATVLEGDTDIPQQVDTRVMMRGVPYNVTTEMDFALWQAAQVIRADPASLTYFQAREAAALANDYLQGYLPTVAQEAIASFMHRYGMRGLAEIDLGRPRWREEPLPILQTLRSYLDITDVNLAPDVVYERGKQSAKAEIDRLAEALRGTRGGWFKARLAHWAARRMRALVGLREAPKFTLVRLFGIMRQALLADGARLTANGLLSLPDDVFFLHMHELDALAAGDRRDWVALVRARRQTFAQEKRRRQIPRLLLSDGQAFYERAAVSETGDGAAVYGEPVSPGVIEGVVRVVLDPRTAQLVPGEILVCPGTDPSWTPLFLTAGGLVMEVGGMMTHGAVVAREYGLPAVVGVHEATQRLHTGQRVRVDGASGQVVLLED
ncbi:MAG: phosphoenolpyruvate synthase [Anaerolineae bacterium]|nr:phosphoenolpyruvate synthase [Anaerolineae bacterium]